MLIHYLGGDYLLSHFRSTIGVVRLNFSVRNGKRWDPHAMTTLLPFQPKRRIGLCRGCDDLKRPSGERYYAKTFIAIPFLRPSEYLSSPSLQLYLSANPSRHAPRGSRQESFRVISTARLRTLPPVHLPPINVVVCNDPNKEILS